MMMANPLLEPTARGPLGPLENISPLRSMKSMPLTHERQTMKGLITKPLSWLQPKWAITLAALGLVASASAWAASLDETIQASMQLDKALRSAEANKEAARENIGIARSRLLPQLNFQGYSQNLNQTTTQNTSLGPQANTFQGDSYTYSLSLRQSLIRPRDLAGYAVGQQQALYGELKYESAKSDLWNRASSAWLDVLAAKANKELYENAIKTISDSAKQELKRFEKGDGTKDSMIEAQAQLKQAQAMLADAEWSLQAKLTSFELLTGIRGSSWSQMTLPDESKVRIDADLKSVILDKIKLQAPEILAAKAAEQVNALRVSQSMYDHFPTLDLVATANRAQNDTTNTLGYQYQNQQLGVQLNVPLFAGGGLEATRRQAVYSYDASVADRESLEYRVETQFENDWATQAGYFERTLAARGLVMSAQEQKRAALMGVSTGLRTWSDVANAELLLARRASDLIGIQTNLYKIQSRILSLLPSSDESWQAWVNLLDQASLK